MLARRSLAVVLVVAGLAPVQSDAQAPRLLPKADAEIKEPFTSVSGVRELSDGRVVVIDSRDKLIEMVDFRNGSATKISREGSGPGEYAFPMRLVALPGDSSGVYDMLNSRVLVVLPNGKPGPFITSSASVVLPHCRGPTSVTTGWVRKRTRTLFRARMRRI